MNRKYKEREYKVGSLVKHTDCPESVGVIMDAPESNSVFFDQTYYIVKWLDTPAKVGRTLTTDVWYYDLEAYKQ
jgi:hypothetical protein